ncbi:B-box zinc finger family protein [Trichomonas vaginalis G3]|uniref:Oxidation resistance protein 1 n=1 Tax=Trichomonas vaginalis (strain ATCC PRA-98 / G3) TaxID=412133 RepID=A2EFX2_TRIV3|nr:zinc ion binding [Trichomonas vaginalis G3]EAY08428.1 B-box zinc finger family protein [Trichomonas vaginalis G3]KAI5518140.1 zinc ion binding [Trichomonas vaginalis G3]|eukprot:XP_001320651.1 B-box zinc finger family protein [Trichomonas vaginalis G3]
MSLPPLDIYSQDFQYVKYLIQKQLDAPRLKIIECLDAASVSAANSFAEFCESLEDKNIVHVFMPLDSLMQPLSDIVTRGVRVNPRKGFKLNVDRILLPDRAAEEITLIHCLVALGMPQNWQHVAAELQDYSFDTSIPTGDAILDGFQSICTNPKQHEYYIFNPNQIRTLHVIKITGGKDLEKVAETSSLCDLCHKREADVYCANCKVKLCNQCDEDAHGHNPVLQSHERIPYSDAITSMECCPFHPKNRVEHICLECGLPVCFQCKLAGNHSQGAAAKHELVPIKDAYHQALLYSNENDRDYNRRRRLIKRKLADADQRLKDVAENTKNLEQTIMKLAREAIENLKQKAGEKALRIRSNQVELQRKLDELEENAAFIETHRDLSNPATFIQALQQHQTITRTELKNDDDLPSDLWVQGDLAVVGSLDIKPRQLTELPEGIKKRDLDFEEKNVRQTVNSTTETYTETQSATETAPSYTETVPSSARHAHRARLSTMAARRAKKVGWELPFKPFNSSSILTNDEEARNLYLCLPFKTTPEPHILFSTERDGKSISRMHQRIDNIGVTIVLIKNGAHVFGGFAASKWNKEGKPFGDGTSTFVFSLTHDAFLPFRARSEDACYLKADYDYISFGGKDIFLSNDFVTCSSEIENSYTAGFPEGSKEAKTYLAGAEKFKADVVEVWGFFQK